MGALNHSQNLYKTRPWELKRTILYDIFSIETSRLKIDLRNIDIIRVSPLMVEGYRYWLNNISRYSYTFFNLKAKNSLYLKTSQINFCKLNWKKILNLLFHIFFYSKNNSNILIINYFFKNSSLKRFRIKNLNYFFNIFLSDSTDILSINYILNFTNKYFGYNNINFIKKIPLNLLNKNQNLFFNKKSQNNLINLDLNLFKTINFQMNNINNVISLQELIKIKENPDNLFFLLYNIPLIFLIKKLKTSIKNLNKIENYNFILEFFDNKLLSKKYNNFMVNFNNIYKFEIKKLFNKKNGIIFFNNNTYYNLSFMGYHSNLKNHSINFIKKEILFLFDITSYINWFKIKKLNSLKKKIININYNLVTEKIQGINIPALSIVSVRNLYLNSFGELVENNKIIKNNQNKKLEDIFNIFSNIYKLQANL